MAADLTDARRWTRDGTTLFLAEADLDEAADTGGRWELPGQGEGGTVTLSGPLAGITAYLTGRAHKLTTAGGKPAPVLGPWL